MSGTEVLYEFYVESMMGDIRKLYLSGKINSAYCQMKSLIDVYLDNFSVNDLIFAIEVIAMYRAKKERTYTWSYDITRLENRIGCKAKNCLETDLRAADVVLIKARFFRISESVSYDYVDSLIEASQITYRWHDDSNGILISSGEYLYTRYRLLGIRDKLTLDDVVQKFLDIETELQYQKYLTEYEFNARLCCLRYFLEILSVKGGIKYAKLRREISKKVYSLEKTLGNNRNANISLLLRFAWPTGSIRF